MMLAQELQQMDVCDKTQMCSTTFSIDMKWYFHEIGGMTDDALAADTWILEAVEEYLKAYAERSAVAKASVGASVRMLKKAA